MEQRDITRIKQVTTRLLGKMKAVADLEIMLKKAEAEQHELEFDIIPTLLHELNVKDITLDGDIQLKVGAYYRASIPKDNQIKAFDWLRKNKFGGIIKHDITTHFTTEQDKAAQKLIQVLKDNGWNFDDKEAVHHMTLTAFIKEQIENGNAKLPLELLGAFVGEKATVKLPKENGHG